MYLKDVLINIIQESYDAIEGTIPHGQALKNINHWADELYNYEDKDNWFKGLKKVNRNEGCWGLEDESWSKQCPCGEWEADRNLKGGYVSQDEWIDKHYPHDEKYQKRKADNEQRILDNIDKRRGESLLGDKDIL